jgi:hypothetical protein
VTIPFTSLIRLNPDKEVAAEDTLAPAALEEAAKKSAEKNPRGVSGRLQVDSESHTISGRRNIPPFDEQLSATLAEASSG